MNEPAAPPVRYAPIWIYFVAMLLPCAACGIAVYEGIKSYRRGLDTEPAEGVVVALEECTYSGDRQKSFLAIVKYSVGQDHLQCKSNLRCNADTYSIGDRVQVLYKRDHPEIATINSFMELWYCSAIFFPAGVLFLAAIVWGLRQRLRGDPLAGVVIKERGLLVNLMKFLKKKPKDGTTPPGGAVGPLGQQLGPPE